MLISSIIRTYNRERLLKRAVESVLSQELGEASIEVIVVNDYGSPLSPSDWQQDDRVTILNTQRVERCVAANTGAGAARGSFLHILDDDDVLLPGAYRELLKRMEDDRVVVAYGSYEQMNDEGLTVGTVRPQERGELFALLLAGETIPLGASLIRRSAYMSVGGMDPAIMPGEDVELLQRLSLTGLFDFTDAVVSRFRVGPEGGTTTPWRIAEQAGRLRREKAFAKRDCAAILSHCAMKPEIRGRLVRYYIGSGARRLRDLSLLASLSRIGSAARLSLPGIPRTRFWRALVNRTDREGA